MAIYNPTIYNPNDLLYFDVLEGRPIWACAYKIDNQTGRSILRQVPVQGEIRGDRFYVYKKDGTLRRTGDVWAGYRWYADTYEECVEAYNRLVNKRKEILLTKLAETEMDFIKEKNNEDSDLSGNLSENL